MKQGYVRKFIMLDNGNIKSIAEYRMEIYGFTSGGSISGPVESSIVHGLYPFGSKKDVSKKFGI
jgi:hypothetical protein